MQHDLLKGRFQHKWVLAIITYHLHPFNQVSCLYNIILHIVCNVFPCTTTQKCHLLKYNNYSKKSIIQWDQQKLWRIYRKINMLKVKHVKKDLSCFLEMHLPRSPRSNDNSSRPNQICNSIQPQLQTNRLWLCDSPINNEYNPLYLELNGLNLCQIFFVQFLTCRNHFAFKIESSYKYSLKLFLNARLMLTA